MDEKQERIAALIAQRDATLRQLTRLALKMEQEVAAIYDAMIEIERRRGPKVVELPRHIVRSEEP